MQQQSGGRNSQNTTIKHYSVQEAHKQKPGQRIGGGQPRSGDPGLGLPPPPRLLLALPQSTSHNSRAATPRRTGTPSHQPTADKAVYPHQGWSSSGRLAFTGFSLRDTSEKHVRHKTLTAHPLLPLPPPPLLLPSWPLGLLPALRVSRALCPPCLAPALPPPPPYA